MNALRKGGNPGTQFPGGGQQTGKGFGKSTPPKGGGKGFQGNKSFAKGGSKGFSRFGKGGAMNMLSDACSFMVQQDQNFGQGWNSGTSAGWGGYYMVSVKQPTPKDDHSNPQVKGLDGHKKEQQPPQCACDVHNQFQVFEETEEE